MPVKFKDYYEALGVARDATPEQIRRAFHTKAKKLHPDVCKEPGAEERFKELNEAYEVLKDPDKRKRYDQLGERWKGGEEFTPPPGFQEVRFDFDGENGFAGFSDFFSTLFGGSPFEAQARRGRAGRDQELELGLSLEEVVRGGTKAVRIESEQGTRSYDVKLPLGLTEGARIRLAGQGEPGRGGAPSGDLYLVVRLLPHPVFTVQEHRLRAAVVLTPWEAVLGTTVSMPTLTGTVELRIPPHTQAGQVLRLRGQGLQDEAGQRGDLLATVRIEVPTAPTPRERELLEQLGREAQFRPSQRVQKL